jgi:hypothetical protein
MAFSGASIKYKTLRVGFLVREGYVEDLVNAAGINSVLWGGIHNPILPISNGNNSFAKQLMELYSVDILYAIVETPEIQSFKNEYPFLRDPAYLAEKIFYEDWDSKKLVSGLLDVKNLFHLYWTREFKTKSNDYKSKFLLRKWDDVDPLANVLALEFGFYPKMNFKWNYEQEFLKALCSEEQKISPRDNLRIIPIDKPGPIQLTGYELRGYGTGFRLNGNGIFLGKADDFNDLLSFWNLRAAGIGLVYVSTNQFERSKQLGQSYLDYLNAIPHKNPTIEDRLTIYHNIDDEEQIKKFITNISSIRSISQYRLSVSSWNGLTIQPNYYVFKWQTGTTHIEQSNKKYIVNVQLPEMNFLLDKDDPDISSQQLGVIIEPFSGGEYDYPGFTLKLPCIRSLNEFYSRAIVFDPWKLRIEKDGFSLIIKTRTESLSLYPVPVQSLVEKIFATAAIQAKTSQPGLIARKIIEKIGGLEDARVLKIKGVRLLLDKGKPETAVTRGQAIRTINENDFEKHKRLYIEARDNPELDSNAVFDYLLKNNYFRAGLELICDHCKLVNWLSLKNIDDSWSCEYCGGQNQTSPHLKHKGDWKFRKSGLFAKDNHQEGAIPVLLTLLTIKRISDHSDFIYTTALELQGKDIKCETDLFVMQEKVFEGFEMCIGECKNEGGIITKDDCDKLKKVAKRLSSIKANAKVYIIFSKTSNNFLPDEIALFKEFSKEINLILFTNRELELYHPYWLESGEVESDIPEKFPHSFNELSRNSHSRYLKG